MTVGCASVLPGIKADTPFVFFVRFFVTYFACQKALYKLDVRVILFFVLHIVTLRDTYNE